MSIPPRDGWPKGHQALAEARGFASWQAWVESIEAQRGHAICGRKTAGRSKAPGTPCPRATKQPNGACIYHGGRALAGEAHPNYRTGKHLSARGIVGRSLRERLEQALEQDPRRMMALGATALLARFDELVDRIDAGSSGPETIQRARELLAQMRVAQDGQEMARLLSELQTTIAAGSKTDEVWSNEFYRVVNLMGLHAERYRRVMEAAGEYVERERAVMLFQRFGTDIVAAIEAADIPPDAKLALRRKIVSIVTGYLNRPALPAAIGV